MKTTGRVNGIISNIVIVKADGPVGQNEICYVWTGDTKMMAEVIKVIGAHRPRIYGGQLSCGKRRIICNHLK